MGADINIPMGFGINITVEHFDGEGKLINRQSTEDDNIKINLADLESLEKYLKKKLEEQLEKEVKQNGNN